MAYMDGYVIPVRKDRLDEYLTLARTMCEVWKDHGAIGVAEGVGDDVPYGEVTSFPRAVQAGEDEVVVFGWAMHADRASRDACNEKVMADPRMQSEALDRLFDGKRMIWGGFNVTVSG